MIVPWSDLKEEAPLAIQLIEHSLGFKYSVAYGTLLNEESEAVQHQHLEKFFDDQGWFMTVYPTEFPGWNGIISDTAGAHILNDPSLFEKVRSRNHAKSLLASLTIKYFQETLKKIITIPKDVLTLKDEHLQEYAKEKELEDIQASDLNDNGRGLMTFTEFVLLKRGKKALVLKTNQKLPLQGMILTL